MLIVKYIYDKIFSHKKF